MNDNSKKNYTMYVDGWYIHSANAKDLRQAVLSGKLSEAQIDICLKDRTRPEIQKLTIQANNISEKQRTEILNLDNQHDRGGHLMAALLFKGGLTQDEQDNGMMSKEARVRESVVQSGSLSVENYDKAIHDVDDDIRLKAVSTNELYGGLTVEQKDFIAKDECQAVREAGEKAIVKQEVVVEDVLI